jgi:uncharacterized protein YcbK (DUF882 family)
MTETKPKAKAKPKQSTKNYFTEKELKCKHTGEYFFDEDFLKTLNKIREECGFPFPVSSACRSPLHPIEQRKQFVGVHTTGKAVDILCRGEDALKLISVAQKHGITRIGVQQKGTGRFIHIDGCTKEDFPDVENYPEVSIWSY